jgi:tetratricopeptide (TPR) repeat protein
VARVWLPLLLLTTWAGVAPAQEPEYQEPPEEDEHLRETEYSFNPLQAAKEFKIGDFYLKRGSYRAAAGRFEEATKWNPGYAEAYLKLGEAREKLAEAEPDETEKQLMMEAAREAYAKYLELAPDAKNAKAVRKKLAK